MIRTLTGLIKKLIDKSEEIITREDEVLDELVTLDTEIMTASDTPATFEEFSAPYYYDSGIRYDESYYG